VKSAGIWLSYDLGVRGDYEGLYSWLDDHEAKECGDSLAYLSYKYEDDLLASLKDDIEKSVALTKNARVYVIFHKAPTKKYVGSFLFGNRRSAPWEGRGALRTTVEIDEGNP
jgi:hypothetical protein